MPLRRLLTLVFAAAAVLPVLATLVGLDGGVPDAAGVIALLAAALYAALFVHRPLARRALAAGIAVMAAGSVVHRLFAGPPPYPSPADLASRFQEVLDREYAAAVLLVIAAAALTVGTAALPQFRRPAWLTAVACLVALVPVAVVAAGVAEQRDLLPPAAGPLMLLWQLAPGLLATVLAGLAVVLAVSRAERWFLVPAGALLVQVTAAHATTRMSGSWSFAESLRGVETGSAFLQPGLRTGEAAATASFDLQAGAALALAALLLGPALIAAGAARTAGAPETGRHPAAPPRDA